MSDHNEKEIITNPNAGLVDIRGVAVDKTLPREQRMEGFVRQIKNPFRFMSCGIAVKASFRKDGPPLEECLLGLMQ